MPAPPDPSLSHACPHVDKNDPRCQSRFRMGELDAMYRYCLGGYYGCRLFHRINREESFSGADERRARAAGDSERTQQVTVRGRKWF